MYLASLKIVKSSNNNKTCYNTMAKNSANNNMVY